MAYQKITDNLYLNQALVVSCSILTTGTGKKNYILKLNNGTDINLTTVCPDNATALSIYNQVKAWEGGGGGGEVGPLEDLMYDDEHTLSEVMDTKLEGDAKNLVYDSETGDTVGEVLAEMQEDIDAPLKDKEYGTVTETITVEDEFVDGQTYSIVKDIPFTEEELALLYELENSTFFYKDVDPSNPELWLHSISWQTTDGSYVSFYTSDDNIPESYYPDGQGWYVESEGIDKYDEYVETYGEAPSFTIYTEYINPQYEGLLKKIFGLSSHTETITRTVTLEEKFEEVEENSVPSSRKVAGKTLEEDTENLQDYEYGQTTKTIITPAEITADVYELPISYDFSKFVLEETLAYSNVPEGAAVVDPTGVFQIGTTTDVPDGFAIMYQCESLYYLYMNFNNTTGWYVLDPIQGMPALVADLPLEFEVESLDNVRDATLLAQILGLQPTEETITVDQTLKDKIEDFANWDYKITEKNNLVEGETYPLKAELNANDMSDLIDELSAAPSIGKSGNYMWGLDGYIIDSTQSNLHWSFYDPQDTKWKDLTVQFVDEPSTITYGYIYGWNVLYYNNKTYITADYNNNGLECDGCIYEASLNPTTQVLTLTRHNITGVSKIYARSMFELDNKLLSKDGYYGNTIYEIDLENYTATLSNYEFFYYTYNGTTGTLWKLTNSLYNYSYRYAMSSGNQMLATSNSSWETSRLRRVQAGDQEALYDQTITLDPTYSLILERTDIEDQYAGTDSSSNLSNMFYATDGTNKILCTFKQDSGSSARIFYVYNEATGDFDSIGCNLPSSAQSNLYNNYMFYAEDGTVYYYDYSNNVLYEQTGIENGDLIFEELPVDDHIYKLVYNKDNATNTEVATIECKWDEIKEQYCLVLNDTYYYYEGTSWVDSNDNPVDLSNLTIDFDWDYLYTDSIFLIQCLANSTTYEKQSLKQYLDNYLNWKYSTSTTKKFFDIPQWENLIEEGTLYDSPDKTDQVIEVHFGVYGTEKTIYITPQGAGRYDNYWICNVDTSYDGDNFKANTWYYYSDDNSTNTEVPTPDLTLMEQYVVDTQINAVYGYKDVSLGDMLNAPLFDKFYGTVDSTKEIVEIVDETEYEFKANMGFSSDDISVLQSLTPGDYIYYEETRGGNGKTIQFDQSGNYLVFVYNDGSDLFEYRIYNTQGRVWVNEWANSGGQIIDNPIFIGNSLSPSASTMGAGDGGAIPAEPILEPQIPSSDSSSSDEGADIWITVYTSAIVNHDIFERMLNITPTVVKTKVDMTLGEKIADLPNWEYEKKGPCIFDVPKWDTILVTESYVQWYTDNTNGIDIEFSYDSSTGIYNFNIIDNANDVQYTIVSQDMSVGVTAKADTWYIFDQQAYSLVKVPTPTFTLDINNVDPVYINLFEALYGEVTLTLKEKIDSLSNGGGGGTTGPLKDETYGEEVQVVGLVTDMSSADISCRYNVVLPQAAPIVLVDNTTIYESDNLLIQYYYNQAHMWPSGTVTNFGFRILCGTTILGYQIMRSNEFVYEWPGITSQSEMPIFDNLDDEDWYNGSRFLPIATQETAPNYRDCYYIYDYEEMVNQPTYWEYTFTDYYYYDDQEMNFVKLSGHEAPEWSDGPFYKPTFRVLMSEPADWANVYDNGDYYWHPYADGGALTLINGLMCKVTKSTITLAQKFAIVENNGLGYITTLPEEPNMSGRLIVVVTNEEPEYKYAGYLYIITE